MRRILAALACAGTAALPAPALATPAQAQARATDPVSALKKQFKTHRGVHMTSVLKFGGGGEAAKSRANGDVQFGASGVTASDITSKIDFGGLAGDDDELQGLNDPTRTITVKKTAYVSGGVFDSFLPEGKTWIRLPGATLSPTITAGQYVNTLDPRTLKAVLATTKAKGDGGTIDGTKTTVYRGSITLGRLFASSPELKKELAAGKAGQTMINWKLWIGADNLVRRVTSSAHEKFKVGKSSVDMVMTTDTKFTGWGSKIIITAPPADEVADAMELGKLPEMPDISLGD